MVPGAVETLLPEHVLTLSSEQATLSKEYVITFA
ncbi:hypothetical protein PMI07_006237 [Rhizobium sp. CF080]|nr:hypothetical protein PMI07_006237 [Rhizobium sp. CF080]